jgi:hypothetical protein
MRSDDGTVIVDVAEAGVTVTAPATKVLASGGTALPLMSKNFLDYWNASILPFLQSEGYAGPLPPSDAVTSILEAQ